MASVAAACLFAFGCKKSSSTPPAIAVTISSPTTTPTIEQGQSVNIVASVANDSSNEGVTWTLSPSGVGTIANATTTQVTYLAPTSVAASTTVTITAISVADVTKSTVFSIHVTPPISILVTPPNIPTGLPVPADGGKQQFTATLNYDENNSGVSWALGGPGCSGATCGTLANSTTTGVQYVAPTVAPTPNLITLTATSIADKTQFYTVTITIGAPSPISVSIASKIGSIVVGSAATQFSATVQDDPNNSGVKWALVVNNQSCQPTCGTLSNATSTGVTYTPPAPPPPPSPDNQPTLVATSNTDSSKFDTDTFTIEPNGASCAGAPAGNESLLQQEYAVWLQGWQGSGTGTPVAIAASFGTDGAGNVTGGEMDINSGTAGPQHLTINAVGSSYSVGQYSTDSGNHVCMILSTSAGNMTFRMALGGVNAGVASRGRIIEFDDSSGSGTVAAGILRQQNAGSFSAGSLQPNYSFGLDGLDSKGTPVSLAGSFGITVAGGVTTIGNAFADIDDAGTLSSALSNGSGQISGISATDGRATATFNIGGHAYNWAVYIVNASELFVVETDSLSSGSLTSGRALATNIDPNHPFNASSLSGNYIFHQSGISSCNNSPCSRVNLGLVNFDGNGTINGLLNQYDIRLGAQQQPITNGTYTVTAASGRAVLAQTSSPISFPVLYLVSPPVEGVSAFIVGSDSTAMFGLAEFQANPNAPPYTAASLAGNSVIGTEDPKSNAITDSVGTANISASPNDGQSANIFGTVDHSGQSGLIGGQTISGGMLLTNFPGVNGTGNGTGYVFSPSFVAVTNGAKIFYIDINSSQIVVIEMQ